MPLSEIFSRAVHKPVRAKKRLDTPDLAYSCTTCVVNVNVRVLSSSFLILQYV